MNETILTLYKEGKSMNYIKDFLKISQKKVSDIIKGSGIIAPVGRRPSCSVDSSFFKEINTEQKAYWFGFLYADGFIMHNGFALSLKVSDKEHLIKMSKDMKSTYKIGEYKNKGFEGKTVDYCKTAITSREMRDDLISLGLVPNKSLILKPPNLEDEEMIRHFIRGFFDGNGCLSGLKKSTYAVKIVSTKDVLDWICSKADISVNRYFKRRPTDIVESIEISALKMDKFLEYIYSDSTVYLDRKFEKYIKVKAER